MKKTDQIAPKTIDEYIAGFPKKVRGILKQIRMTIREAVPDAKEKISYKIPTFYLNGNLVHFAGWKRHIGFYPTSSGIKRFKRALSGFDCAKGSVHFPLDKPIPFSLISKIVKYRAKENLKKAGPKRKAK